MIDHDSTLEDEKENTANGKISSAYDHNMERYNEDECPVFEQIEVPKALGDLVESLIGAIFLDSNCDLKIVWNFIEKLFGDQLEKIMKVKHKNFTAELMELFPGKVIFKNPEVMKDGKVSRMVVVSKTLSDSKPMQFKGIGRNKLSAKLAASKCALREMKRRKII